MIYIYLSYYKLLLIITRVYDENISLSIAVELADEVGHPGCREVDGIESEILELVHVVDVCPHYLEWEAGHGVSGHHLF